MNFSTNAQNVISNSTINPLPWSLKNFKVLVFLKETAKIQGAAGGRPTRLTPKIDHPSHLFRKDRKRKNNTRSY